MKHAMETFTRMIRRCQFGSKLGSTCMNKPGQVRGLVVNRNFFPSSKNNQGSEQNLQWLPTVSNDILTDGHDGTTWHIIAVNYVDLCGT